MIAQQASCGHTRRRAIGGPLTDPPARPSHRQILQRAMPPGQSARAPDRRRARWFRDAPGSSATALAALPPAPTPAVSACFWEESIQEAPAATTSYPAAGARAARSAGAAALPAGRRTSGRALTAPATPPERMMTCNPLATENPARAPRASTPLGLPAAPARAAASLPAAPDRPAQAVARRRVAQPPPAAACAPSRRQTTGRRRRQ